MEQLNELGFYTLAGNAETPRDCIKEIADAERLGLGNAFLSERFNYKEAATICGAVGACSKTLGIATSATNPNTRNPMVTAAMCATMNRLTDGRFALGLGRGGGKYMKAWGLNTNTMKIMEDYVDIIRRLTRGEAVVNHDGPAGKYPGLKLFSESMDDEVPIMSVAIGPKMIEWAGSVMDGVMLHTFFSDATLEKAVKLARRGADLAGRDPSKVRVWSVLAVIPDTLSADEQLLRVIARMGAYLQFYGDILVEMNDWDPAILKRFNEDKIISSSGMLDDHAVPQSVLEHAAGIIPKEWLEASAMGSPKSIAQRIVDQFNCGADGVILHGVAPNELENILPAYRAIRPNELFLGRVANPGK